MRLKKSIKRGIAAVTITGIMASSAMPAFAKDYHIDYGDIKVDQDKVSYTDKDGTKYDNEKTRMATSPSPENRTRTPSPSRMPTSPLRISKSTGAPPPRQQMVLLFP